MDILTAQECQDIINDSHTWETVDLTKTNGSVLKFKYAPYTKWKNQYPLMLKEAVMRCDVGDFLQPAHIESPWLDVNPNTMAYASWVTPLNDGYTGGDLIIDGQTVTQTIGVAIKRQRDVPYEVTPVTSGTRYTLLSWLFVEGDWSPQQFWCPPLT